MLAVWHSTLYLGLLGVATAYAVVAHGGDAPRDSSAVLLVVGLAAIVGSLAVVARRPAAGSERLIDLAALLVPAYAAFQLVPLSLPVLGILSPTRAELTTALGGVMAPPYFVPISINPENGWAYLSRIAAYALIFLLVRQSVRQRPQTPWVPAAPLIATGLFEAVWGLAGRAPDGLPISGTYFNRNHFAGLLELVLPLAVMCGITVLHRGRHRTGFSAPHALGACALFVAALLIFLGIAFSLSKMGFVAALGSLVVVGVIGLGRAVSGWKRAAVCAGLLLLFLTAFLFLSPAQLVEQYGTVATERTSEGRMPIWSDAARLFWAYPLFGIGLGNFFSGLLRYQSSGLDFAWTAAHNDYVQLLTELGVVGSLIVAILIGAVLARALRVALRGSTGDTRLLGLACAGSLTAILIHSVTDFNTYVLANAMVLSWIAGLAAGLPCSPREATAPQPVARQFPVHRFLLVVGCLVSAYSAASLLYMHRYAGDPRAERIFCRLGVCDTRGTLAALRDRHGVVTNGELPADDLLPYLPRDPAAPFRWEDLGKAMQNAGRIEQARYCFSRALALAPNAPATLLTAAEFHFDLGETRTALDLVSRSLEAGPPRDRPVFASLEDREVGVDDVLRHVLLDRRSAQVYLRRLLSSGHSADAARAWEWISARGYVDDKLAAEYVDFLLRTGTAEAAAEAWALHASHLSPGYPETTRIFNGDFELDATGSRFDWRIDRSRAAAIDFDSEVRYSGERSLRLAFDGTKNPGEIGVEQVVFLEAGRYRFQAYMRTRDISTDQGVAFRVVYPDAPQHLDATTDDLRGSHDWTLLEREFDAPPGGGLVRVSVVRRPSLKFDNLIRGTAWIDQVSISLVEGAKPASP